MITFIKNASFDTFSSIFAQLFTPKSVIRFLQKSILSSSASTMTEMTILKEIQTLILEYIIKIFLHLRYKQKAYEDIRTCHSVSKYLIDSIIYTSS